MIRLCGGFLHCNARSGSESLTGDALRTRAEKIRYRKAKLFFAYAVLFKYPRAESLALHRYAQQKMLSADITVAETACRRSGVFYCKLGTLSELSVAFQDIYPLIQRTYK